MLKKLRAKFVFINMLLVTVMLCAILGLLCYSTQTSLKNESLDMMQSVAASPFSFLNPYSQSDEIRLPYFTLQITVGGNIIASGNGYYDLSDEDMLSELINIVYDRGEAEGVIREYKLRYYCSDYLGSQTVVFADMSSEIATLEALLKTCLIIGGLAFLVFLGISLALARWAVHPVEEAWTQQRQFVADASHELKTPLTVIMTNAELLQNPDYDEDSRRRFAAGILTVSQQMRELVERLLELARADNGQSKAEFAELDLSRLCENALLPFDPVFFERALTLSGSIQPDIYVRGSAQHLQQLVDILLDNAQKYADAPGFVHVKLESAGHNRCRLSVENSGAPIAPEDLKNIFKRFYRADKARSRDGSFGLGLSIAQSIAELHHGKIWAESKDGVNSFRVELPTI